jgi:DNA-directed RNA polymerase subunit RPC12/RpoP
MQQYSVYSADCLCGRQFEAKSREYVCPACGRQIFLEGGMESAGNHAESKTPVDSEEHPYE